VCAEGPLARTIILAAVPAALLIATMLSPVVIRAGDCSGRKTRNGHGASTAPAADFASLGVSRRRLGLGLGLDGHARGGNFAAGAFVAEHSAGERLFHVVTRLAVLGDVQAVVLLAL
jgi:hypothetical protein